MIKVKDINGSTIKLEVRSFSYQGNFMGESYISFDVNSPVYINFEIGDYIEYRGERFVLNYIPSPIKNGTPGKSGDAFVYRDVKFNSLADELTRCDFLDVVLADNHVHFTSLSKFSFYAATVKDLADRIQANLNRLYNGGEAWTVTVEEDVAVKDKSLSVDNINCWEALSLVNSDFDANFVISERTIRIGTAGISVGTVFGYGKGNGLINIEQSTNNDSLIVTRLRAYGSTRNIPYRYYNNLKDSNGTPLIPESMYVNTLMLPDFAENGGDAYVDSPNITRIGIREKSVYFDGSGGLPEIYPSIEGMTAEELKAAGINVNATGRIDEVVSAEQMTDDGIVPEDKEELDKKTFTITLKDIGFNPVDKKHLTTETPFISMKTGMCGGREFEITGCEEKGNNYILTCNREMDSSINKAFPNNPYQVSAGDQFVFIGIAMDDIYIKAAEQRLLTAAKDYLSNNDKSKYTYLPKIDKVFMARHPEIASSLKEGNILDFKDTDLGIDVSVIIQSLVIKEGGPVPEYEITLFNDKVVSTIEKIQNSITSLASNTGITIEQAKSLFATWVEAWRVKWFDQKLHTYDPVKFNSVTSTDFESKLKGWIIDALGNAEFRDVLLRSFKSWNFAAGPLGAGVGMVNDDELQTDKLLVRKIMYVLEMMIQRMRFQGGIMVLSPATGFKIDRVETFDTYYRVYCRPEDFNEFEVNDQARIQNFNGNNIKYLWSLVLSRGDDYIDISRVDKDGEGVPAEGDEIVQLGNRTNPDRQDAVLLSAVNGEVGIFTYYGINSFDLSSKEGSWLGKHGGKKGAVIRGEVHITAGSSGLEQFDEYDDVDKRIQDAKDLADSIQDVVNNLTSIIIPDMQGQIDGSIMSHEGKVPPTLTNEPAVNWTTEEEKNRHIGDYYDYYLTVDGEQVTERYKFSKVNGTYQWVRVADSGSALAASVAREALGLAGTKATITWGNTLPEAPYNINDMWIKLDGSMYICNHQRLDGETGSQSDWQLFNDTMLRLAKMADDNVITKEEKATLRDTWNQIQKEFTAYQAQATKYGVSITALQNAYNTLNTFLTNTVKIAQDIDSNLSVAQKTEYNQDFANYYSERTAFANVIAQKVADESVGNLQIGMVNLLKGSNVELKNQGYALGNYYYDTTPEVGKTYTIVLCYTLGENNTSIGAYQDGGNYGTGGNFNKKGDKVITSHTFKFSCPNDPKFMRFFQFPDGTYGSKVHWAVLVEGNKGPNAWIPSLSEQGETAAKNEMNNLQIGGINLADYSGGDFLDVLGLYSGDRQYASKTTIDGKTCLQFNRNSANCRFAHVMVEDDEYTFSLWVKGSEEYDAQVNHYNGSNYGSTTVHVTTSWERKVITFTAKAGSDIIHFGTKNTIYITDWKYEKGNKATDWSPSIADQNRLSREIAKVEAELAETKANAYADGIVTEAEQNAINEAQARLDALKIGSVNLVSRKMMLAWNEKNKDIAVWGQDSDGIYLSINPRLLYENIGGSASYNDIFENKIKYKSNTQYVFSIEWKAFVVQTTTYDGLSLTVHYTDGTKESLFNTTRTQSTNTRTDFITQKGKTIQKISCTYGTSYVRTLVYSPALYEGNKVLAEPPVATEDLQGQSNVNLVDGGKEVTVTVTVGDNYAARLLVVPVLKPNTVYHVSFKAKNLAGSPPYYTAALYDKNISVKYFRLDSVSGGIMITPNNFTEGEATLLLYAGVAGSTNGNSVKYTEVMLVEGFTPPSSYSPSPGDVAKDIKDVSDAVTSLQNFTDQAFADGIITRSEAQAIASNINVLNAEKADIDAYYTKLYANAYLTGTAKTNLASAKTAYNTAHANLINSINTAIADGKATATEKADVDAKFSAYNNALSAYQTRVGEADKAIQDTIKKVADDAQTSANTAQSAANAAQSAANQAQADANAANSKLTTWASDNYISPQEKTALRQQKSDIQSEQKDIEANANRYGISLASYMTAYNSAISALNKYTATSPENIQVIQSEYDNIAAYYPARQTILNSIAAAAKAQADKATWAIGMDGGKMLYDDPEFKKGLNGVSTYGAQNNGDNGKGTVVLSRISKSTGNTSSNSFTAAEAAHVKEEAAGSPHNGSDWCLYIKAYGGTTINHLGGFSFGNQSRANAVFIVKVSAKIPVGYTLVNAHNAHGTGYKHERLTPMAGTGKYETYIFKETCGPTGTFSSVNYLHLFGPVKPESDPLEWFVDYATVFDMTADGYGDIVEIAKTETVAGINNNPDSVTVYAKKTDFNSLNQVVNQQGSQLQVNTNSIDAIVTKNGSGTIVSIKPEMVEITGATVIKDGNGNKVNIFGVGDKVISVNGGMFSVDGNGKVIMQNAEIAGKVTAKIGQIGPFTIEELWLRGNNLAMSGSQLNYSYSGHQVYVGSHPDMTTAGGTKLGTFMLSGGGYGGLESDKQVALIVGAPSNNNSYALALTSGLALIKGQVIFDKPTVSASSVVTIGFNSGHFVMLTTITGNSVVSVSAGLPVGSWFLIGQATAAGGYYYIKLSGSERFQRRGNAYQQVNSHNQDPSLIFKISSTSWLIGNLPVNWIDWN